MCGAAAAEITPQRGYKTNGTEHTVVHRASRLVAMLRSLLVASADKECIWLLELRAALGTNQINSNQPNQIKSNLVLDLI